MHQQKLRGLLVGMVGGQLLLVALGASYVDLSSFGPIGGIFNYWGEASGANQSYGFFAPGIGSQVRTRFAYVDNQGRSVAVPLFDRVSREAELRVSNITEKLAGDDDDAEDMRRSMSASLAGKIFGRYPEARQVTVAVDEFLPLNIPEYQAGQRAQWREIYVATYRYQPDSAEQGGRL